MLFPRYGRINIRDLMASQLLNGCDGMSVGVQSMYKLPTYALPHLHCCACLAFPCISIVCVLTFPYRPRLLW